MLVEPGLEGPVVREPGEAVGYRSGKKIKQLPQRTQRKTKMNEKFDKQKMLDLMRVEYEFVERTLALIPAEKMLEPDVQPKHGNKTQVTDRNERRSPFS